MDPIVVVMLLAEDFLRVKDHVSVILGVFAPLQNAQRLEELRAIDPVGFVGVDEVEHLLGQADRLGWHPQRSLDEMKNEISQQFRKFLAFSEFFWHFFAKYRDSFSFPEHFREIPANFHQIISNLFSPKNRKFHRKTRMKK